ncbi:MAG: hypothetical protein V1775_19205 [Bacteroidota bacterium]
MKPILLSIITALWITLGSKGPEPGDTVMHCRSIDVMNDSLIFK